MKKIIIERTNRLNQLPPDPFSFAREDRKDSLLRKLAVIDLGRFVWPGRELATDAEGLAPASTDLLANLKEELAGWFLSHHGIKINPEKEIFIGGGISQLIYQIALAFIDHGDIAFVPDVGVPLYRRVTAACGGEPIGYPVSAKNGWHPDLRKLDSRLGRVARLLFINSPHNPTGTELTSRELEEIVWQAARENVIVVNDAAYQTLSGRKIASALSPTGARRSVVETYSFAYTFGLPATPFGFMVGNREVISAVNQTSTLIPSSIPTYLVKAAISAVRHFPDDSLAEIRSLIKKNSLEIGNLLNILALERAGADMVPFVWAKIPRRRQALNAATTLYRRSRILCAPGKAFGDHGEGFLRFSLTSSGDEIEKACARAKRKAILKNLRGAR